jgi:maltose/moltooligosaccharide transporter
MRRALIRGLIPVFIVQFFAWTGMFALWIYTTPVVIERLSPGAPSDSPQYLNGLTWVGVCFACYALLSAILNFAQPWAFATFGRMQAYAGALVLGAIGIGLVPFAQGPAALLGCFALIGVAWSLISNIPYAIGSELAREEEVTKVMNVIAFSVVIPQVVAVLLFGLVTRSLFSGHVAATMELGAASMALGAVTVLTLKVGRTL